MGGYVKRKRVKCKSDDCNNLVLRGFCAECYSSGKVKEMEDMRSNMMRERYRKDRLALIEAFGGKCQNPKCLVIGGCRDARCLQFDHINGDGYKERKIRKHDFCRYWLNHLEEAKKRLQLYCANCNWIKKIENKEYRQRGSNRYDL